MWNECVIDASMPVRDGFFNFCPIEGDIHGEFQVITGMNYLSAVPPKGMRFVAVVHPDGQEAAEAFCGEHAEALNAFRLVDWHAPLTEADIREGQAIAREAGMLKDSADD